MIKLDELEQRLACFGLEEMLVVGALLSVLLVILLGLCVVSWLTPTVAVIGSLVTPVATMFYIQSCAEKWRDW